jgi:hypothetical protein
MLNNIEFLTMAAIAALVLLAVVPAGVAAATIFQDEFESKSRMRGKRENLMSGSVRGGS